MNFRSLILICAVGMAFGQSAGTGKAQNYSSGDGSPVCLTKHENGFVEIIPCSPFKVVGEGKPEPLDVPAIRSKPHIHPDNCKVHSSENGVESRNDSPLPWCEWSPEWSCKDKSRILEHDENDPPKYWCRKVQP